MGPRQLLECVIWVKRIFAYVSLIDSLMPDRGDPIW